MNLEIPGSSFHRAGKVIWEQGVPISRKEIRRRLAKARDLTWKRIDEKGIHQGRNEES